MAGTWGGKADDLLIERIELIPFRKVLLINVEIERGTLRVDEHGLTTVAAAPSPGATPVEGYFLDGTVLSLYHPNSTLDTREIIHADSTFVYQNNRWGRRLGANDDVLDDFGSWVAEFLKPPAPEDPKFGATQQAVVNEFYSFLWGYGLGHGDPNPRLVCPSMHSVVVDPSTGQERASHRPIPVVYRSLQRSG
jgi:hypothetical protein